MQLNLTDYAIPGVLPRLIGRDDDLAFLGRLLRDVDVRLITLVGPAGVGKTRLAQAAAEAAEGFEEPPKFVDLSPTREPALVLGAVADQTGVHGTRGTALERLQAACGDQHHLFVLDNFEQVLSAAADVASLLARLPRLKLLITSRAPLGLRAEHVVLLAPLALPDLAHLPPLAELAHVPSVQLFLDRAEAMGAPIHLTSESARIIAELCVRLDGLPLAIELAAARSPVLSPSMILERLGHRLSLLQWDAQDLPERQHTLRAALDWSYELLQDQERALFRLLGVFMGGFTVEAAETLAAAALENAEPVIDLLTSLVAKSLVVSDAAANGTRRFRLLESIQEYALEQLAAQGAEVAARRAHAEYMLALAEQAIPEFGGILPYDAPPGGVPEPVSRLRLEEELDNLRAAMAWLAKGPEREIEVQLATAVGVFWYIRGGVAQEGRWLEPALRRAADTEPRLRLPALTVLAWLFADQLDLDGARTTFLEVLDLARSSGAAYFVNRALLGLAYVETESGSSAHAIPSLEEALTIAEQEQDRWGADAARSFLGFVAYQQGDLERAGAFFEVSLAHSEAAQDVWAASLYSSALGIAALERGDLRRAVGLLERALAGFRATDDLWEAGRTLVGLAVAQARLGDSSASLKSLSESLDLSSRLRSVWRLRSVAAALVSLYGNHAEPELCARLLGALDRMREIHGGRPGPDPVAPTEGVGQHVLRQLGSERAEAAKAEGSTLSFDQVVALVGELLHQAGASATTDAMRPDRDELLSQREHETLVLVAQGLSNREIAARLYVAERTVKHYVKGVFNKLGVNSRTQAIAAGTRLGLL